MYGVFCHSSVQTRKHSGSQALSQMGVKCPVDRHSKEKCSIFRMLPYKFPI